MISDDVIPGQTQTTSDPFLVHLHSLLQFSHANRAVLKLRDQKQMDFEDLSEYLSNLTAERDRLDAVIHGRAGSTGLGLGAYLKDRVDALRGADDDRSRVEKMGKLEGKIKELEDAVTVAHDTSDAFSEETLREQKIFQCAKEAEMKELLGNLADGQIEFYKAVSGGSLLSSRSVAVADAVECRLWTNGNASSRSYNVFGWTYKGTFWICVIVCPCIIGLFILYSVALYMTQSKELKLRWIADDDGSRIRLRDPLGHVLHVRNKCRGILYRYVEYDARNDVLGGFYRSLDHEISWTILELVVAPQPTVFRVSSVDGNLRTDRRMLCVLAVA